MALKSAYTDQFGTTQLPRTGHHRKGDRVPQKVNKNQYSSMTGTKSSYDKKMTYKKKVKKIGY